MFRGQRRRRPGAHESETWRTDTGSPPRWHPNSGRAGPLSTLVGVLLRVLLDRGLGRVGWEDFDRFDIHHLEEAVATQLAANAAMLDAPEGHPRIRLHDAVHEHHAGLDLAHESLGPLQVLCPEACAQPELRIVRFTHRGVEVRHDEDRCDRTERLFVQPPHRLRHAAEDGGLVEPTGTRDTLSTDFDPCPFADRVLHLALDLLPLGFVDERSNVRGGRKGIPDTEHPDLFDELRGELLCDGVYDEDPLRGDARLPRVHEAAGDRPFRRGVEVGVVRDDERIRPAKFQDGLLQVLRGLLSHLHAGPDGAGQADEGDGRIDQGRGRGPVPDHALERHVRKPGFPKPLPEPHRLLVRVLVLPQDLRDLEQVRGALLWLETRPRWEGLAGRPDFRPRLRCRQNRIGGQGFLSRRVDDVERTTLRGPGLASRRHGDLLSRLRSPRQIILCGSRGEERLDAIRRIAEGRLISRPAMKAPRAWVAQLGQRRSVEVAVPQGFAGSNPAPRIFSGHRSRGSVTQPMSQPRASAMRIASVTTADSNSPARALESACVTLMRSTAWISSGSGRRSVA